LNVTAQIHREVVGTHHPEPVGDTPESEPFLSLLVVARFSSDGLNPFLLDDGQEPQRRRGGLRIIYYLLTADCQVWFFTIYDKDEAADLSQDEKHALQQAIQAELAQRRPKR